MFFFENLKLICILVIKFLIFYLIFIKKLLVKLPIFFIYIPNLLLFLILLFKKKILLLFIKPQKKF